MQDRLIVKQKNIVFNAILEQFKTCFFSCIGETQSVSFVYVKKQIL